MSRTEEMQEMHKYVTTTPGGFNSIAKRVTEGGYYSLSEAEYVDLWKAEAGSNAAFCKEFAGERTIKHQGYDVIHDVAMVELCKARAPGGYPNRMSVEVVSTEVGSGSVTDDSYKAADQLKAKVEEQRRLAPTLTTSQLFERVYSNPENKDVVARAHRRPTASSPSYDAEMNR